MNDSINMLEYYINPNIGPLFYGDHESDEFLRIKCLAGLNDIQYCKYFFFISRNISADASFLDLRRHGGRDFANEKIRQIRKVLCPRIGCDGVGENGEFLLWHGIETGE